MCKSIEIQFRSICRTHIMKLVIDSRETHLYALLKGGENIETRQLTIGDALLIDEEGMVHIIIERKTVQDLASSITDGRYAEQSARLDSCGTPNHNIIYLVEGSIMGYRSRGRVTTQILRSSIVSLSVYKGFSVMCTTGLSETKEYLLSLLAKVEKNTAAGKKIYSSGCSIHYDETLSMTKLGKATPDTIAMHMLCQVPGVSKTISAALLRTHKLSELMEMSQPNIELLTYETDGGKTRKVPKNITKAIGEYLSVL